LGRIRGQFGDGGFLPRNAGKAGLPFICQGNGAIVGVGVGVAVGVGVGVTVGVGVGSVRVENV